MSWTACVKGIFKRDVKEKNRSNEDNGALSTILEIHGAIDETNKDTYIKKIGPWGGDGGLYKDTKVAFVSLKNIKIRSGQYIHSLEFSYSDEKGVEHHAGPWGICDILTYRVLDQIHLGREEFLIGISGTVDTSNYYGTNIISSLTFITNIGQYGPFGSTGQIPFRSPPMSNNSSIVGFFGRSGDLVDAIGLYVKIEREPMDKQDLITKVGPWGGILGPNHDVDMAPRRLISMVVCSGKVIDSLTFIYNDRDGHQHTAGPWGGLGTSKKGAFHTIMLGRSEIVKEVSGTFCVNTITSLTFVTNIATYGPFGHGEGIPFCSPAQDHDSIVGFFAKAEQHINAIGFYLTSTEKQDNDGDAGTSRNQEDINGIDKNYITKIGPWGGCKGNHKDIEVAHSCLNSITIRSGEVVYSLAFSYKDSNGKKLHAGPWGGSEGFSYGSFDTIQLGPLEFLTEVSGTVGSSSKYSSNVLTEVSGTTDFSSHYSSDVVTSIIFITNVGRYGPYGGGGGIPFHSPTLSSGSIVGFFAHAERVVDAIGIYVNPKREPTIEQDSVMKIGPWGGESGRPNDLDVLPQRLISIVVHSGEVINSISFSYIDCNGQEHTAGPWGRMGEPLDGSSQTIRVDQTDFLREVSGTIGPSSEHSDVVTSLFFITNSGSHGPYGKGGGTRFRSPVQTNGSIVGFFVIAEEVISAIGVYFRLDREIVKEQVEGSKISTGMPNKIVDSRDRVDILENMLLDKNVEPINVPLSLLQHITEDFNDQRIIGKGGFAVVYKADLQNGSVAIKKLSNAYKIEDEKLFYHEATCLISVKHENIVRFLGYCANTEQIVWPLPSPTEKSKYVFAENIERLLCFEYIENGSLDKYLTDELRGLEWHTRYNIIKGICNGLDYLHNKKSIIHRDLKPANILVDGLMVPKITDFGISKLLEGATHAVTTNPAMSFGYTAPEFINCHEVSFKSDLYSLGVIIKELVTGSKDDPDINNVHRRWRHRWNKSAKYPQFGYQQVTKCIEIASRCLSDSPNKRPCVRDILSVLNNIESTDVEINGAGECPAGPISPYPWELLEFDKLELNFPFEINKQTPCSLELTNVTNDYAAFSIQYTGTDYCIEPNKGVVPARSKCTVIVTLQARQSVPHATMCKAELVVRSAAVNEGVTVENIHEDMFDIKSSKLVDEVTLKAVILRVAST